MTPTNSSVNANFASAGSSAPTRISAWIVVSTVPAASRPTAADEERKAEHEEKIPDDAAGDRRLDELDVSFAERDDGDDELRGVAERRVEKAAECGPEAPREAFSAAADQSRERHERCRRGDEDPRRLVVHRLDRPGGGNGNEQQVEAVVEKGAQHRTSIAESIDVLFGRAGQQIEERVE